MLHIIKEMSDFEREKRNVQIFELIFGWKKLDAFCYIYWVQNFLVYGLNHFKVIICGNFFCQTFIFLVCHLKFQKCLQILTLNFKLDFHRHL